MRFRFNFQWWFVTETSRVCCSSAASEQRRSRLFSQEINKHLFLNHSNSLLLSQWLIKFITSSAYFIFIYAPIFEFVKNLHTLYSYMPLSSTLSKIRTFWMTVPGTLYHSHVIPCSKASSTTTSYSRSSTLVLELVDCGVSSEEEDVKNKKPYYRSMNESIETYFFDKCINYCTVHQNSSSQYWYHICLLVRL